MYTLMNNECMYYVKYVQYALAINLETCGSGSIIENHIQLHTNETTYCFVFYE